MAKYVLQENITDCGVACLLFILRYYVGDSTFDNIRYLTNCSKNGINAYDLIEAAKKLGFDSNGIKCDLNYIINSNIKLPVIAHTFINKSYKHYLIIHNIDLKKEMIIVFDPGIGFKNYSYNEFNNIFSNIIITLYPIRKLDNIKNKINYKIFLNLIREYIYKYILIIVISFIFIIISLFATFYFKMLIENKSIIKSVYYIFLIVLIIKSFLQFVQEKLIIKLRRLVDERITITVYNKLISLPNDYFRSRHTGDLINRINSIEYIVELFSRVPIVIIIDITLLVFTVIILINISLQLFLVFLIFVIFYFVIYLLFNSKNKRSIKSIHEEESLLITDIEESISGIDTIKNMNITNYTLNKHKGCYNRFIKSRNAYEYSINIQNTIKNFIIFFGINTSLYIGIKLVNNDLLLFSNLILFNSLLLYFLEPLRSIFELEDVIKNGIISLKRISEIFAINNKDGNYEDKINSIKVTNLSFSHNLKKVFNKLNINIDVKEKVFIVGSSGVGKTTFCNILLKNHNVDNNFIYLNGVDINNWSRESILKNICYITEDEKIFSGTILENILLDKYVSKKMFNEILKYTYVSNIFNEKKINKSSYIFDRGTNFSLGEKQRIILARCLLRDCNVLILDEALSGIDSYTSKKIIKNILKLYKNKIVIYISHRKDHINLFDKVINLSNKKGENNEKIN